MRKISANPSHTEHWHAWAEGGFQTRAWLPPSHTFLRQSIKAPKSQLYTHRGRSRWDSVTAQIGGCCTDKWRPRLTERDDQSDSGDTNMHMMWVAMCGAKKKSKFKHRRAIPRVSCANTRHTHNHILFHIYIQWFNCCVLLFILKVPWYAKLPFLQ